MARAGWIDIATSRPVQLTKYGLRAAADKPKADPKRWRLSGIDGQGVHYILDGEDNGYWEERRSWMLCRIQCDRSSLSAPRTGCSLNGVCVLGRGRRLKPECARPCRPRVRAHQLALPRLAAV